MYIKIDASLITLFSAAPSFVFSCDVYVIMQSTRLFALNFAQYNIIPFLCRLSTEPTHRNMLRACHGAQSAPPGMAMKRLHLMSSIETFLDDTSAMELDGSFLTYSDMDFSSDGSDFREKQHQMALNTTFLSPIDRSGIYQKFESTQFLPFDPDVSVTCQGDLTDRDISGSASPLSISSWELDSQSDDIVAPPNSPNTTDANESMRRQLIVKAMQNYVATSRATDSVVKCVDPTCCSFVSCGCTESERSTSTSGREIVRKIADFANDTCDDLDVAMLGERPPCDGMESPQETLQALKALPLATRRKHACSDGNVSSVMKHKKQNRSDVKTRQTSGKSIKEVRQLLSKPVVKCSKLTLPSNVNSDDDMPRTSQYNTATRCCREPNSNRDVCALRARLPPAKPSQLTLKPIVSSRTLSNNSRKKPPCYIANNMNPSDALPGNGTTLSVTTLSCSINSDATCFMKRPLCRGGVTSRGQHVSQTRQAILSKKLKQIGRYLHRSSGVRRMHLIPELQTLGVV